MTTKPMHLDGVTVAKAIDKAAGEAAPVAATESVAGVVKQAAHQAHAAGANPTQAEYDALLDALVAAGIMAAS